MGRKLFALGLAVLGVVTLVWAYGYPDFEPKTSPTALYHTTSMELSGAYWVNEPGMWGDRGMFVVNDNGTLGFLESDGTYTHMMNLPSGYTDAEAVTRMSNCNDCFLYVGIEHPDSILEIYVCDAYPYVRRTFDLTPWMTGPTNAGLEGLAWMRPYSNQACVGFFYAGLQADGLIYMFTVEPPWSTSEDVTYIGTRECKPGRTGISEIAIDDLGMGLMYTLWDSGPDYLRMDEVDCTHRDEWTLNNNIGYSIEGLALGDRDASDGWSCDDGPCPEDDCKLWIINDDTGNSNVWEFSFGETPECFGLQ